MNPPFFCRMAMPCSIMSMIIITMNISVCQEVLFPRLHKPLGYETVLLLPMLSLEEET